MLRNKFRGIPWRIGIISLAWLLMGADECNHAKNEQTIQLEKKMQNTQQLMANQPTSKIQWSMDRFLMNERLDQFNNPNLTSHFYIILNDGTWIHLYIIGKTASTSKRLTSTDAMQNFPDPRPEFTNQQYLHLTEAPDEMGVWGKSSGDAKVAMTALSFLLEFGGQYTYLYSEVPLKLEGLLRPMVTLVVEDASPQEINTFRARITRAQEQYISATTPRAVPQGQ